MKTDKTLEVSLLILRVSLGILFLVWSIGKIVAPGLTQFVAETFYSSQAEVTRLMAAVVGIIQLLIVLAFLVGIAKTWSYGALLGMHLVSVVVAYKPLLAPYTPPNTLFWAGIPTLGALIALFLLRDRDQLFTLGNRHSNSQDISSHSI